MKKYIPGFTISLVFLVLLSLIDSQIHKNVMPLSFLITLLVLHVIFFEQLITYKKRLPYLIFAVVFIVSVYFSLPNITYNQAKEKVLLVYELAIVETYTVPLLKEWNPFDPDQAYVFKVVNSSSEEFSIMVSPSTGKLFVIEQ